MAALTRDDVEAFVFNHWHESLPLSAVDRYLLPLLDGRHDRDALVDALVDVTKRGALQIDTDDGEVLHDNDIREVLAQWVDALPQRLEEMKLMSWCKYPARVAYRRRA